MVTIIEAIRMMKKFYAVIVLIVEKSVIVADVTVLVYPIHPKHVQYDSTLDIYTIMVWPGYC